MIELNRNYSMVVLYVCRMLITRHLNAIMAYNYLLSLASYNLHKKERNNALEIKYNTPYIRIQN